MKKIYLSTLVAVTLSATQMPPMPPMSQNISHKHMEKSVAMPKECKQLPSMLLFLPPPMKGELKSCQNALSKPKRAFAQKQLMKLLRKRVIIRSITTLKKFSKLYRIEYLGGVVLCNDKVDACIEMSRITP